MVFSPSSQFWAYANEDTAGKGAFARAFFLWQRPSVTETMANYLRSHIATKSVKETMSK